MEEKIVPVLTVTTVMQKKNHKRSRRIAGGQRMIEKEIEIKRLEKEKSKGGELMGNCLVCGGLTK